MPTLPIPPLHLIVLLPVTVAAFGFFLPRRLFHIVLLVTHAVMVVSAVAVFAEVRWGSQLVEVVAGWPDGIGIRLVADRYSAPMLLLATTFAAATFLFSTRASYMDNTFLFVFMLIETGILGTFLSADVFNVYVLFELMMLAISILIMYKRDQQSVYDAMLYLMMNFIGMAFMLLGIGYLYRTTGVLDFWLLQERLAELSDPRAVVIPYALIMTAVAMKSALFPLFGWLPRAHGAPSAPSIVSAILSGVQVKVGVYLLVRLQWTFMPAIDASGFFAVLGFVTATVGFLLAIAQKDIKLILAYHTVSQVGLIVMGLHGGSDLAFWGGMYHMINHAFFKGLLFLTAGIIIEEYGVRSYDKIRGVLRRMPAVGVAALAGVLGITGAPFFNGSISKYFIQEGLQGNLWELAIYVVNLGTLLSFVKYSTILFGRPEIGEAKQEQPAERPSRDPFVNGISLIIGAVCFAGGIFGGPAVALVFGPEYTATGAYSAEKIVAFLVMLVLAVAAYFGLVRRVDGVLAAVRRHKFSFNQVTVFLTGFFLALLAYGYVTV